MMKRVVFIAAMVLALVMHAQDVRPVLTMFTTDIGCVRALDTYLSPITYSGTDAALGLSVARATGFAPDRWIWQVATQGEYGYVKNPVGNHHMHVAMGELAVDMQRRWRDVFTQHLQIFVGPQVKGRFGALINNNNSNNTVSVKANATVGLAAMAAYSWHIGRLPVTIRYQADLPVAGCFFAPDYDESYYEIYLGNHRNLAHFGWWGNRFDLSHSITADLHLGNVVVRIGYRNRIERSWINHLNTHLTSHSLVIGIGGELLSVGRKERASRRVVSALYEPFNISTP